MASILSFRHNQDYYTTAKIILDCIIGFVVGWMGFGAGLWFQFAAITGIALLALSIAAIYFGRKWLGILMLVGAVCTTAFFVYATRGI